jgi:hypothetical protein
MTLEQRERLAVRHPHHLRLAPQHFAECEPPGGELLLEVPPRRVAADGTDQGVEGVDVRDRAVVVDEDRERYFLRDVVVFFAEDVFRVLVFFARELLLAAFSLAAPAVALVLRARVVDFAFGASSEPAAAFVRRVRFGAASSSALAAALRVRRFVAGSGSGAGSAGTGAAASS